MTIFDSIRFPVSCPPTWKEIQALPVKLLVDYIQLEAEDIGSRYPLSDEYLQHILQKWIEEWEEPPEV